MLSPKANEEFTTVAYGCIRFIDSYRYLSSSLDSLLKTLDFNDFNNLNYRISKSLAISG